jgi:hypothetical protein
MHIAITARPDILPAVSLAGRYGHNPGKLHWEALLKVVSYLIDSRNHCLILTGEFPSKALQLFAYADSDLAGDKTRKSRTGYVVYLNNSLICYSFKLQSSFALSTMESETHVGCTTAQCVMWCRNFLQEMGYKQTTPTILYEDNNSCITINSSWKAHPGSRHYELKQFFLRESG